MYNRRNEMIQKYLVDIRDSKEIKKILILITF